MERDIEQTEYVLPEVVELGDALDLTLGKGGSHWDGQAAEDKKEDIC
jgi:hypothetical protein